MADDAIHGGRNFGLQQVDLRRIFLEYGVHGFDAGVALESARAGNNFVEDGAETENVGAMIDDVAAHLFGRHVADGAENRAGRSGGGRGDGGAAGAGTCAEGRLLGQAKIENFYAVVVGDENVFGLEVAMHDALVVCGGETVGKMQREVRDFALRERTAFHAFAESVAFQVFGDEVVRGVLRADVVDSQKIWMADGAEDARFVFETEKAVGVRGQRFRQDLDGHGAIQAGVAREINFAHAPGAERRENFVGP